EAASSRGGAQDMLLDRIHVGIDDRTAVEGADRQFDLQGLDQKVHADGRPARDNGESDFRLMQALDCGDRAIGQGLVFGQQRAVDVGNHHRNAGHVRFPCRIPLSAWFKFSWRTMSSTMLSAGASIDTVIGRSSAAGGSRVANWLASKAAGMKCPLRLASLFAMRCCVPAR